MFFGSKKVTTTTLYKYFSSKEMAMWSKTELFSWLSCHSFWEMCKSGAHSDYSTGCFLSLIRSWNWLQLPAGFVRACKLKQEEKGRSNCFSCAEEGWGMSFVVTPLSFQLRV